MKLIVILMTFLLAGADLFAQAPLNWTVDEINPGEDLTLFPDGSVFTEGLKSCHLQLNKGSVPYLISEVFYITPGSAYTFSFDVLDYDTAGQVKVYADFYDTYGFDVFGQPPVFSVDSSEWQSVSWEGIVPAQAVVGYVMIKFYNEPNPYNFTRTANIWIDNMQFHQAGGDNLLANGGFEEWALGVDENFDKNDLLSVYPNPATDFINIDFKGDVKSIIISDMTGREVFRSSNFKTSPTRIDISNLTKGIYVVSSITKDNSILKRKLVKD